METSKRQRKCHCNCNSCNCDKICNCQICGCNNGRDLRNSHFSLGRDKPVPLTQYKHDYPEHEVKSFRPPDGSALRRSNIKFGDDLNPYQTSAQAQNEKILNAGPCSQPLSQDTKNDLRKSHFKLGNFQPDFDTTFRTEYYDKSGLQPKDDVDFKNVERNLRKQNYELGDDKPDYITEFKARYTKPNIPPQSRQNLSTAELQKSNYVLGTTPAPWNTTHLATYVPKMVEHNPMKQNITKTNFCLGDFPPTKNTHNADTYVKHPFVFQPQDPNLIKDLRDSHFYLGHDPNSHITQSMQTYLDPTKYPGYVPNQILDNKTLRASHWGLADPNGNPNGLYDSTYRVTHTPKKADPNILPNNNARMTNFNINGALPMDYLTDYRDNYIPKDLNLNPNHQKIIDDAIKKIKGTNFQFGDMPTDYSTQMRDSYKYNPEEAKNSAPGLDKGLKADLKATHYKLGYEPFMGQSTQNKDYVPLNINVREPTDPGLRADHLNFGKQNFDGETIYHSDYTKKKPAICTCCCDK